MSKANGFLADTKGQLDINLAVAAILGLILASAFLVIGIVVLQGIVDGAGIASGDTFYYALDNVTNDIESSMSLAGTMLLVIIGVAILMMLAGVMVIMRMFR
jgi:predicted outer membrane lipoprotein